MVSVQMDTGSLDDTHRIVHLLTQTKWSHVGPYLFDVSEAFRLRPTLCRVAPPEGIRAVGGGDRVLSLVIHHDSILFIFFSFVVVHWKSFIKSFGGWILSLDHPRS